MPTVNSIVSQANMVAHLSTKFFPGNREAANQSLLVAPGYGNFFNFLKSEFGGQPALTTLIENYSNNRETFSENFRENLESLQESSNKVKESAESEAAENKNEDTAEIKDTDNDKNTGETLSTLGEFANGNIPPELRNLANIPLQPAANSGSEPPQKNSLQDFAKNYLTAETPKNNDNTSNADENSLISEVRNLVNDFNATKSYLDENRGVSNRMAALADNFNNSKLNGSLNNIGISTNSEGFLSLNESTFNDALNNDSESVNSALGSEGLAGKLEKNIELANFQGDRLFTSIMDFANKNAQDETESLYSNNAAYAKENTPRLFTMFT
jgi:hypothetical protein